MNTLLNLTIERRWFDMILSGEKHEEYRAVDNSQVKNAWESIYNYEYGEYYVMVLRNGYRMSSRALAIQVYGIILRSGKDSIYPEWGEPTDRDHLVIILGDVLKRGTYADVKDWLEKRD